MDSTKDSVEDSNENDGILTTILPFEMWEEILDRVDNSRDLRNFCKAWASTDWDKLLHRTKQSWLFDEVFPFIFPYLLTKQEILCCRMVCWRWCNAVDYFLENNPCRRPHQNSIDTRLGVVTKSLRDRGLLHTNISADKVKKILQVGQEIYPINRKNPVIGRSVYFTLSADKEQDVDDNSTLEFLSKVGHHIWDFRLEIREDTPLAFVICLREHLKLLPNLKRLEVFGESPLVIETKVEQNLQELERNRKSLNLPQLPFLETLDVTIFGQYRDTIIGTLLSIYSTQLVRLTLHCYVITGKFDQLSELTISVDNDSQLEPFSHLNLPLRRLTIYILRNSRRGNYPDFSKIFQVINTSFAPTLRCLSIEFPVTYSFIQWSRQTALPILQLPHLKTLELKEATFHSFNFISQLTSLEYLHLYKYRCGNRVGMAWHHFEVNDINLQENFEEEVLDLKDLLDNPTMIQPDAVQQSNLWSVSTRLKHFTLNKANNNASAGVEHSFRRSPNYV